MELVNAIFCDESLRPGSVDPGAKPSTIITLDLSTAGFYDRLMLFNTLNNALNRGYLNQLKVSPNGFSFKPIPSGKVDQPVTNACLLV